MSRRPVVIVGFPGAQALDVVGPFEVFAGATSALAAVGRTTEGYDVSFVGTDVTVTTESGLTLVANPLPHRASRIDTIIVPGGDGVHAARKDAELQRWLAYAGARSRRLATVCSGTFVAAETGLLDGCRVTTHWARARRLMIEFPLLTVDAEPLYINDGRVWSSAGVTAGIDLALAMVADDVGADIAQTVSRWLVMFLHRPGGQAQFAAPVWSRYAQRDGVHVAQMAIAAEPHSDHSVAALARRAAMSPRHFSRLFTAQVGDSPARYVEHVRVQRARDLLETTDDTLDAIANQCGLGTAETLRRVVRKHLGVTPDAYRRRFRLSA